MKIIVVLGAALTLAACVTTETAQFKPSAGQETMIRDGNPAIVSKKPRSIVLARPASREIQNGGRPVYIIAAFNSGSEPVLLSTSNIHVEQFIDGQPAGNLKVMSYNDLVQEERSKQVLAAVLVGVAAGANAASAQNAGYYNSRSTIYTPRGTATVYTTGYSPAAAAIAQGNANAQNAAMMASVVERGQQNMLALEQQVLKDNTVMPGEWIGGQVHIAPPAKTAGMKEYRITVTIGSDVHEIDVAQGAAGS